MSKAKSLQRVGLLGLVMLAGSHGTPAAPDASRLPQSSIETAIVANLLHKDLTGIPGKELQMLTVEYPPGGGSPPHSHHAQVFVYVLSGSLLMQVAGSPVVKVGPGQTFYEGREDVHTVSRNASASEAAKFLVFMIMDTPAHSRADTPAGRSSR
jgi:quercetin dioxygenase-like cupin family protein